MKAKDFIDYIANKESLIAKAAGSTLPTSNSSRTAGSRTIPQSVSNTPSSTNQNRKKISAPTQEFNAKKSAQKPASSVDVRNRRQTVGEASTRTSFISNHDRDVGNANLDRVAAVNANASHSDRISFISNSDRYSDRHQTGRSNYGHAIEINQMQDINRNAFMSNDRFPPHINHFDRIAYMGNNERTYYDQNNERNNFRGSSDRYINSDNFVRNDFQDINPTEFYDNGGGSIYNGNHARSGSFSSRTDSSVEYMGNSDRHQAGNGTTRFVVKADPTQKKAVISSKKAVKTSLPASMPRKSPINDVVIDLVDSNVGTKRKEKEKEKSGEDNGMSFKKPAATRITQLAPASPSSSLPSSRSSLPPPPPPPPSFPQPSVNTKRTAPSLNYIAATSSSQSIKSNKSSSSSSSASSSSSDSSTSSSSSSSTDSAIAQQTNRPPSQSSPSKSASSRHSSQSSSQPPQTRPLSQPSSSRSAPPSPPPKTPSSRPSSQSSQSSSHTTPRSSSSSKQLKDGPFTDRKDSNFHDMTRDESDEESENELDRIKINKVLALIQTLSSLADRQQMAEQLLDKYNVSPYLIGIGTVFLHFTSVTLLMDDFGTTLMNNRIVTSFLPPFILSHNYLNAIFPYTFNHIRIISNKQTKPAKTKKLINAGKEIFQEWLLEEVLNFSKETNIALVEMMLKVADKVQSLYHSYS